MECTLNASGNIRTECVGCIHFFFLESNFNYLNFSHLYVFENAFLFWSGFIPIVQSIFDRKTNALFNWKKMTIERTLSLTVSNKRRRNYCDFIGISAFYEYSMNISLDYFHR